MKINKTSVKTTTKNNAAAKKVQPKAQVASAASSKAASKAVPQIAASSGINTGKTTGIRVMLFQDMTLATNDRAVRPAPLAHIPGQLTDTELAKVWRDEFPNSRAVLAGRIDESIVRGVRNLYVNGMGGHGTVGRVQVSVPYAIGADGKRTPTTYVRVRKPVAPAAEPVVAKAAKPVKAAAKPVVRKRLAA